MWRKACAAFVLAAVMVAAAPMAKAQMSKDAKIRSAMAAGPASITKYATIMDWPDQNGKMATLREGTNGWTCFPTETPNKYRKNDAGCLDATFMEWAAAVAAKRAPVVKSVGYAHMHNNDDWESNTDPYATAPATGNQWHHVGPHVMLVYPDVAMLTGLPTQPSTIGPYVMYSGTPYAHVMWPLK